MISILNILFKPPRGYYKNTNRVVSREGKLILHWVSLKDGRHSLLPTEHEWWLPELQYEEISEVHTQFFRI